MTTTSVQPGPGAPILVVRDLVKTYGGVRALDGVTLDLVPGEVHCLAGENGCGKSTLIKIISGVERPDAGEIVVDGTPRAAMDARAAIKSGIQVIYQDFALFANLTVAENIAMTAAVARRSRLYSRRSVRPRVRSVVDELGLALDLDAEVGTLSVADRQLTAICRALASEARVIIMDEPTTALTHTEVQRLFALVERLRGRGVALMFVSHKLDEVLAVSQRVTILRSGRQVATAPAADLDRRTIARHMTGRDVDDSRLVADVPDDSPPVLEVEHLSLPGAYDDITFAVRSGEILGVTGLLGSGRTEIAEALFGLLPPREGVVKVDGRPVRLLTIDDAISAGIGYVPEDRLSQGLFLNRSIADNIVAASLDRHRGRTGLVDVDMVRATVGRLFTRLRIKAPSAALPVRALSGGNAQRVVLAKWLARKPRVLVLNGPTVGVDIGSKHEILDILRGEAAAGTAIVMISDDAPELAAGCHRVLVVKQGRIVHTLEGAEVTADTIVTQVAA